MSFYVSENTDCSAHETNLYKQNLKKKVKFKKENSTYIHIFVMFDEFIINNKI